MVPSHRARRLVGLACAGVLLGLLALTAPLASATPLPTPPVSIRRVALPCPIPIEALPAVLRDEIRPVIERPTLASLGPAETFPCNPEHYWWFLNHPDRAVRAWRRLGAKCVNIVDRGDGSFAWSDDQGSEIIWQTVYADAQRRMWYAKGKVRPGPLMPLVPVRVVVVMNHSEKRGADGSTHIQHRADAYLHTDSKTAALLTRALGNSAQRIAEDGLGQMQLFFSTLCYYLQRHPDRIEMLLKAAANED